ncbi:antifreeze protein [Neogemmobacter tilapiae]|uniref:Antifreeze protein n=1 Tax=Neogemmobacter tilapiae TaxID=875041 RepID=A0A918TVY4_9RHOB|nr:antifreeze protein [Gemmobacter tilapiae]GHC61379.1 hypothetical protein GCM10007315_26740 [Gemmobacter tilapiae]
MRAYDPTEAMRLWMQMGLMTMEAQATVAMRLWGMAGMWKTAPDEMQRMVQEKSDAMQQSAKAATNAALQGKSGVGIASAALKPLRQKTQANAKRLTARGPKLPKL